EETLKLLCRKEFCKIRLRVFRAFKSHRDPISMLYPQRDDAKTFLRPRSRMVEDQLYHLIDFATCTLLLAALAWNKRNQMMCNRRYSAGAGKSHKPISVDVAV